MTSLPAASRRADSRHPAAIEVYAESAGGGLALQSAQEIGLLTCTLYTGTRRNGRARARVALTAAGFDHDDPAQHLAGDPPPVLPRDGLAFVGRGGKRPAVRASE
jgi:hypothetical protein